MERVDTEAGLRFQNEKTLKRWPEAVAPNRRWILLIRRPRRFVSVVQRPNKIVSRWPHQSIYKVAPFWQRQQLGSTERRDPFSLQPDLLEIMSFDCENQSVLRKEVGPIGLIPHRENGRPMAPTHGINLEAPER